MRGQAPASSATVFPPPMSFRKPGPALRLQANCKNGMDILPQYKTTAGEKHIQIMICVKLAFQVANCARPITLPSQSSVIRPSPILGS